MVVCPNLSFASIKGNMEFKLSRQRWSNGTCDEHDSQCTEWAWIFEELDEWSFRDQIKPESSKHLEEKDSLKAEKT